MLGVSSGAEVSPEPVKLQGRTGQGRAGKGAGMDPLTTGTQEPGAWDLVFQATETMLCTFVLIFFLPMTGSLYVAQIYVYLCTHIFVCM